VGDGGGAERFEGFEAGRGVVPSTKTKQKSSITYYILFRLFEILKIA
jgi:hypothetical protein